MGDTVVSYEGHLRSRAKHDASGAIIVMDAPKELGGLEDGFCRAICWVCRSAAAFLASWALPRDPWTSTSPERR